MSRIFDIRSIYQVGKILAYCFHDSRFHARSIRDGENATELDRVGNLQTLGRGRRENDTCMRGSLWKQVRNRDGILWLPTAKGFLRQLG